MEISFVSVVGLAALAVVLLWIWRFVKRVWLKPKILESYLRRQGLVGTHYTPFLGDLRRNFGMMSEARSKPINLTDDITPRVMPLFQNMFKAHGTTFFTWFGPTPMIALTNPEHIKEVLNKFYDYEKSHAFPLIRLIATGLTDYDGDKWVKHRRIINPAFSLEKIKNMVPAFSQSCSNIVGEWERLVTEKGSSCEVDVWPWIVNMTAEAISRTAFGSSYREGHMIFKLQTELGERIMQAFKKNYIPGYRFLPTKNNRKIQVVDREIRVILRRIISKREKAREAGEALNGDLLGTLLESNSGQSKGNGMSIEEVMEECKLFYFGGQETTAVLLVWTTVLLSHHQDWQARAREEVMQVLGDKKLDMESLGQLKVMKMILYEVLRLYPPVYQLNRWVHKEIKLGDFTLPGGVLVYLPIMLIHRNTELWGSDAGEFKPERFKDGLLKATKNRFSFFPFGGGPRICIGQNFALLEAKVALALILKRFSFELSPSYVHSPIAAITLNPQFGAHLILHRL